MNTPLTYGAAQLPCHKNEDRFRIWEDLGTGSLGFESQLYTVFDGHGGPAAASYCQQHFGDYILEAFHSLYGRQPFAPKEDEDFTQEDARLKDKFYELDKHVREHTLQR